LNRPAVRPRRPGGVFRPVASVKRQVRQHFHGTRHIEQARVTSTEAIERFITATTAAAAGPPVPIRTARQPERDIARAEAELAAAEI